MFKNHHSFRAKMPPLKKPTLTSRTGDECVIPLLAINTHALLESKVIRMHFKFEQCKFGCSNLVFSFVRNFYPNLINYMEFIYPPNCNEGNFQQ